jgi:hypothetical protein
MTAESLGMRMKSYYDGGHLCRISYHPRARIAHALADGWSEFVAPQAIQPVATLHRWRHGDQHGPVTSPLRAFSLPINSRARWATGWTEWNRTTRRNPLTRKAHKAAPTGFEPVSPP